MFCLLNKRGEFGVRLSPEDKAEFHKKYSAAPFMSYGAVIKDYVIFPQDLLNDTSTTLEWMNKGCEYVNTLKPK